MRPRNDSAGPANRVIALLLKHGWQTDGATPIRKFRTGSATSPIYGASGGKICLTGGRMRFAKPNSLMKATVGKITTYFYEVENGETRNFVNIRTREFDRIEKWAKAEVCYKRSDAIRRGLESEWVEKNAWLLDDPEVAETIIRDCIPGGQICDPQEIADNIRTWFKSSDGRLCPETARYCEPVSTETASDKGKATDSRAARRCSSVIADGTLAIGKPDDTMSGSRPTRPPSEAFFAENAKNPTGALYDSHPRGESDLAVTQDCPPAGGFPSDDLLAFSITEALGERCDDFNQDCYTCQAWQQYDRLTTSSPAEVSEDELAAWCSRNQIFPSWDAARALLARYKIERLDRLASGRR